MKISSLKFDVNLVGFSGQNERSAQTCAKSASTGISILLNCLMRERSYYFPAEAPKIISEYVRTNYGISYIRISIVQNLLSPLFLSLPHIHMYIFNHSFIQLTLSLSSRKCSISIMLLILDPHSI